MKKTSGVLLPVFSIPSKFGIGDLGDNAKIFIDFLKKSGFKYWQILPLSPTNAVNGYSPYSSSSAFAGNLLFIDPMFFARVGLLVSDEQIMQFAIENTGKCNYDYAINVKKEIISLAYANLSANPSQFAELKNEFDNFSHDNSDWLYPYADFVTAKSVFGDVAWSEFPEGVKNLEADALADLREKNKDTWDRECFVQFIFYKQLDEIFEYAKSRGVGIISDLPFYISYDSSDVWADKANFSLYENGSQRGVAGVPPDYFCPTGQRWGNPLYNWSFMEQDNFSWWRKRIKHTLRYSTLCRIDHMRALEAYWSVNEECDTAIDGQWVKTPGYKLLNLVKKDFDDKLPLIAEDLGVITPQVRHMLTHFNLPGMKVLQFAFDSDKKNPYLPKNIAENTVCYTGTHDNSTILGWCLSRDEAAFKKTLDLLKIKEKISPEELAKRLIHTCLIARSKLAILPMQDILLKDDSCRTNIPGTCSGNWIWQMTDEDFALVTDRAKIRELRKLNKMTERAPYFIRLSK